MPSIIQKDTIYHGRIPYVPLKRVHSNEKITEESPETEQNKQNKRKKIADDQDPGVENIEEIENVDFMGGNATSSISIEPAEIITTADYPYIKSINLKNFMCHTNLTIDLHPDLNFITGQNGRGKSAIMTAIFVCFAGESSANDRGRLKDLVKSGCNTAQIEISLNNTGLNAYRPESFGSEFKIVTTIRLSEKINAPPSVTYQIMSNIGAPLGRGKELIQTVLRHMKINVNNPTDFMNQSIAKTFLTKIKASTLYHFFYHGSGAAEIERSYNAYLDEYRQLCIRMRGVRKRAELVDKLRFENKIERSKYENLDAIKIKLLKYEQLLLWKQYFAKNAAYLKNLRILKLLNERMDSNREKLRLLKIEHEQITDDIQRCSSDTKFAEVNKEMKERKNQKYQLKQEIKDLDTSARVSKEILDDLDAVTVKLEGELETLKTQTESSQESKTLAEKNQQMETLKMTKRNRERKLQKSRESFELKQIQLKELDTTHESAIEEIGKTVQLIFTRSNELENFKTTYNRYPKEIQEVCKEIEENQRLSSNVIAPLGNFIKIRSEYALFRDVICLHLGEYMNDFIVSNAKYKKKLLKVMKKHNCKATVNVIDFRANPDIGGHYPSSKFATLDKALKMDSKIVFNSLLLKTNFIKTILVDKISKGWELTQDGFPRNVEKMLFKDGYQIDASAENLLQAMEHDDRRLGEILVENDDEVTNLTEEIDTLNNKVDSLKKRDAKTMREIGKLLNDSVKANKKNKSYEKKLDSINVSILNLQSEIQWLDLTIDSSPQKASLKTLKESRQRKEIEKAKHSKTLETIEAQKSNKVRELEILESRLADLRELTDEKFDNMAIMKELERKSLKVSKDIDKYENKLDINEGNFSKFDSMDFEEIKRDVERLKESAIIANKKFLFARYPDNYDDEQDVKIEERTEDNISSSISELKDKRNRFKTELDLVTPTDTDVDEIISRIIERSQELRIEKNNINADINFFNSTSHIPSVVNDGLKLLSYIVENDSQMVTLTFNNLVKMRYRDLHLKIDNAKKLIKIENRAHLNSTVDRIASMSGGEKSFSALCLMISIWDHTQSALRALDEYDVFTDSANQQLMTKMLVQHAKHAKSQFILISPLDLHLEDPREAQIQSAPYKVKVISIQIHLPHNSAIQIQFQARQFLVVGKGSSASLAVVGFVFDPFWPPKCVYLPPLLC